MNDQQDRQSLENVGQVIGSTVDLFICSSSFESRCLSIPRRILPNVVRSAVILKNSDIREVEENAGKLSVHFSSVGCLVEVATGDPIASADAMYHCLERLVVRGDLRRVAVDITTFTHEQLLMLLAILRRLGCTTVRCLYTGASAYMTGQSKWLSQGIADTRSVLGFSGELGIRAGSRLVVLVGFELERARRLIDVYDPTSLALGVGRRVDAIEDVHYRMNKEFFEQLAIHYPDASTFEFSCNDAKATAEIVANQCKDDDLAPVVAPLNTKISTVGVALAAFDDRSIQVCYAQAAVYNCTSYSSPGEFFRSFEIDLKPGE